MDAVSVCAKCWGITLHSTEEQEFLEQLHELNNKINFTKELSFRETLACVDIQDIVDRLKIKRGAVLSLAELEGPILIPHAAQRGDCRKNMSTYVSDCYDSIAIFLCIHIILRFKAITAKRNIPALDKYWEAVLEMLWPRREQLMTVKRWKDFSSSFGPEHSLDYSAGEGVLQHVEALSQDVMCSFTNFENSTSIIQGALTQLIQYYHGFHIVLSQPTFRSLAVCSELINLHHLMVEVKKHKPNL
ncbi:hypothetical protein MHYP_G00170630 [Metynnis hypsauchen]